MTSIQLSQWVGGELDDCFPNLTVDVHHPELTVHVEVRERAAYVHGNPEPGPAACPFPSTARVCHCSRAVSTPPYPPI